MRYSRSGRGVKRPRPGPLGGGSPANRIFPVIFTHPRNFLANLNVRLMIGAARAPNKGKEKRMYLRKHHRPVVVVLPDRTVLSVADLPDDGTRRWVASRKAKVALAVLHGLIERDEAQTRYRLSDEEIESWVRKVAVKGAAGLKTTRMQDPGIPRRRRGQGAQEAGGVK